MHSLSPFQFLPPHVIRLIANHVAGSSRLVFDGVYTSSHEYLMLLKPLMWICHNFRAVAYPLYCSYFRISAGKAFRVNDSESSVRKPRSLLCNYMLHMAKDVYINVDECEVYSGAALRILSQEYGDDCVFPLSRTFTLILESYTSEDLDESDHSDDSSELGDKCEGHQANVSAFVLWIKQNLPKVNEVRVEMGRSFSHESVCDLHFNELVSQLYRLGTRIGYSCNNRGDVPEVSQLDEIRDLVHINFDDEYGSNQCMHLARLNAQTLQSLVIKSRVFYDVDGLIQSPDGDYATYPCLHILKLREYGTYRISERLFFPGAVPFPSRRSLSLRLPYLFGDDTLFRGNSATLEILALETDTFLASMLRQHSVFTPSSHPRLHCVRFGDLEILVPNPFATYVEGIQFALSVGPRAPVRKIRGPCSEGLLSALSLPGDHSSIQVLWVPSTRFDIWKAISLIKALPLLSDLHAPMPSLGAIPDGVSKADLPTYMVSTHAPMGERFRCWHIESYTYGVESIMLLALICPNFSYAAMSKEQRESFMYALDVSIGLDRFRPYAPRLRRLLFNGWQNC